ncbi:AlpA family phage regulatory protein [Bosea sp. (in: a-proteobacteria)]|uniref:helix-turn-helix transcriptional regulator n=1 Tax=Bosea sp. (in: a-proteobacteria) TaxID=1871050 RepID=UPI0025BFBEB7|nr:AlpA family phage regulatory protein [Bosea sp. (in: a-proteobacteria)]
MAQSMTADNDNTPILISIKEAAKLTSMSRPLINILRIEGDFPRAVQLSERRIAFVRTEVMDWIKRHVAARTEVVA